MTFRCAVCMVGAQPSWRAERDGRTWLVCDACHRGRSKNTDITYTRLGPPIDTNSAPIGRHHPDTAHAAAERALPRTGSRRRAAYDLIREEGGLTAEEVGARLNLPHQSYSATVSTLARDGWLVDSGRRRLTNAGNEAIVYEAR